MNLINQLLSSYSSSLNINTAQQCNFYISNDSSQIQLPVPPSALEVNVKNNNSTVNINNLGELNMLGKSGLINISLSSFFPAQQYYFCQCTVESDPYNYINKIMGWKDSGKPISFVVTGTNINYTMAIESFKYGEKDGTGDIYFTLDMKEYKFINGNPSTANIGLNGLATRTDLNTIANKEKNITVYPGDSIMDVASRTLGQSTKIDGQTADYLKLYKVLAKRGGINVGQVLKIKTGSNSIKIGDYNVHL